MHNAITETGGGEALSVRQVLGDVLPAFERLRQQGKTRFLGLTAIGDTRALHQVIDARAFASAQVVYNMLNPSAAAALYPAQDYGRLFDHTMAAGVGVVGIRVLAGGALSGSAERHPIASPPPEPIGSAMSYAGDIVRARRLMPLVKEGFAASLTEAATSQRMQRHRCASTTKCSQQTQNLGGGARRGAASRFLDIGIRPSRWACFLAALRARRMASAFSRVLRSEGFSYALRRFISRKTPSRCIFFLSTLRA